MSFYYTHLFIPESPTQRPSTSELARFLDGVIQKGILGPSPQLVFQRILPATPKAMTITNPYSGETLSFASSAYEGGDLEDLPDLAAFEEKARGINDFNLGLSGNGIPPLSVGSFDTEGWKPFNGPFDLSIRCCLRAKVVSMSDLHDDEPKEELIRFGEPCTVDNRDAYYSHPENLQVIQVPGAGCASFWIELEYEGKSLFPEFSNDKVSSADPWFTQFAEETFHLRFLQGCVWG